MQSHEFTLVSGVALGNWPALHWNRHSTDWSQVTSRGLFLPFQGPADLESHIPQRVNITKADIWLLLNLSWRSTATSFQMVSEKQMYSGVNPIFWKSLQLMHEYSSGKASLTAPFSNRKRSMWFYFGKPIAVSTKAKIWVCYLETPGSEIIIAYTTTALNLLKLPEVAIFHFLMFFVFCLSQLLGANRAEKNPTRSLVKRCWLWGQVYVQWSLIPATARPGGSYCTTLSLCFPSSKRGFLQFIHS